MISIPTPLHFPLPFFFFFFASPPFLRFPLCPFPLPTHSDRSLPSILPTPFFLISLLPPPPPHFLLFSIVFLPPPLPSPRGAPLPPPKYTHAYTHTHIHTHSSDNVPSSAKFKSSMSPKHDDLETLIPPPDSSASRSRTSTPGKVFASAQSQTRRESLAQAQKPRDGTSVPQITTITPGGIYITQSTVAPSAGIIITLLASTCGNSTAYVCYNWKPVAPPPPPKLRSANTKHLEAVAITPNRGT